MLTYNLDNLQGESMYAHLYSCIKKDITQKRLQAGEKLPSKRTLAKNLGVSLITVENAYAQLLVEGYITSQPKRGYYVAQLEQLPQIQAQPSQPQYAEAQEATQAKTSFDADFVTSSVPPDTFPYNVWSRLMRHTLANDRHLLLNDASASGVLELRQALANHLYQFRGMRVDPEQIVIGAGTQVLYNLIVQLLGRDRIYALEDPGYPRLADIYRSNDVSCRFLPMDGQGIQLSALEESGADILHITPSHQFPTGIIVPIQRRYELLHWADAGADRYIIEDDYDCEFRLYGKPIPALQSIDANGKVIYINTFSRTLAPTLRISYMLLPVKLAKLFHQRLGFYSCTVSNLEQLTLAHFIEQGYFERHLNRMRTYYRGKRDLVLKHIEDSPLAPHLKVEGEDGGLHFLLHLRTEASDAQLKQDAADAGIRIAFLSEYYRQEDKPSSHTLLMNYAGMDDEKLFVYLKALFQVLGKYTN